MKKFLLVTFGLLPVLGILAVVLLPLLLGNPKKEIAYHASEKVYTPLIISETLPVVREKIIRLLDPNSELVSQLTFQEKQQVENAILNTHNKKNIECMTLVSPSAEKKSECAQLVRENMAKATRHVSEQLVRDPQFHFSVKTPGELEKGYEGDVPYNYNLRSLVFIYETRGFADTDAVLKNYLALDRKIREHDLWLSKDALGMGSENSLSSQLKESELENFHLTNEYTYYGKPVLGTSDYILELKSVDVGRTEINVQPLFPRVLAGTRFESGCHALYCPRFVYDLHPVEKYDDERISLKDYLSAHLK